MSEGQSEILASLNVGAMLEFQMSGGEEFVVPAAYMGQTVLAPGTPPSRPYYTVTMYEFNGENEAKISLQVEGDSNASWACAVTSEDGLQNPLVLQAAPGQFILTDQGAGAISIRNTFAPPGPFVGIVLAPDFVYFGAGFEQVDYSLFTIFVVG